MSIKTKTMKAFMIVMASAMAIPALADKNDKVTLQETPVKVSEISGRDGCFGDRMKLTRAV